MYEVRCTMYEEAGGQKYEKRSTMYEVSGFRTINFYQIENAIFFMFQTIEP